MATRQSTVPLSAWPRTGASATPLWMATATSARSTVTAPPPCVTPRCALPKWARRCSATSIRIRSTSSPTTTTPSASLPCCPPVSPTFWWTALRALPWVWPPTCLPTTSPSQSTPPSPCLKTPTSRLTNSSRLSLLPTSPPAVPSMATPAYAKPTRPAAAAWLSVPRLPSSPKPTTRL